MSRAILAVSRSSASRRSQVAASADLASLLIALGLSAISAPGAREAELDSSGYAPQGAPQLLASPSPNLRQPPATAPEPRPRAEAAYARLPLAFIPTAGRIDRSVRYHAQGAGF